MTRSLLVVSALGLMILAACSSPEKPADSLSSVSDSVQMAQSALYLQVLTQYDDGAAQTGQLNCYVPLNVTPPYSKTCRLQVPELTLHFSKVIFAMGSAMTDGSCEQIVFQPYYYRRSTSTTYQPMNSTVTTDAVDCSTGSDARCWGGAAPALLGSKFPAYRGFYFIPSTHPNQTYTMDSSDTRLSSTNSDLSFRTNVDTCNNLPTGSRANPITTADVRYAGSNYYQDYVVQCLDKWAEPQYTLYLTIGDDDTPSTASSTTDDFYDWGQ